jgi:hypothetical protein
MDRLSAMTNPDDRDIAIQIAASHGSDEVVATTLKADGRVLARVTDGIYRQPGSAIRELISNAYDADAGRVIITTDRPRFDRITVEDDGTGMSPEAVVHLLHHIGGSAKRSPEGIELGVTSSNVNFSPGGRRLIGKIGIGLFSIAQLTQTFTIITKTTGDSWRTVANVILKQYSDEQLADSEDIYEAGLVSIWQEPASDIDAHGTTVVLDRIRPKTKETLQSAGDWLRIEKDSLDAPKFNIGRYRPSAASGELRQDRGKLENVPWNEEDEPAQAFTKLVAAVWRELERGDKNPRLDKMFDYYLFMIWDLSLAIPVPYIDGHPFDVSFEDSVNVYQLPGAGPGRATEVQLSGDQTIRDRLKLPNTRSEAADFRVVIDDLELRRPLVFRNLPATSNKVKSPMMFVGQLRESFSGVDRELSGGPLAFQAYLLWAPKIAPVDHVGVLVRVHGASGTLFDPSFFRYQVQEPTRLRQISCEIFVTEGLDSAINLDRESFNFAHAHIVRLTSWLHNALSRAIAQQKLVASYVREHAREEGERAERSAVDSVVSRAWEEITGDDDDVPPVLLRTSPPADGSAGSYIFNRLRVLGDLAYSSTAQARRIERQVIAIAQVLDAYELLDVLEPNQRENLMRLIVDVLKAGA